VKFCDGLEMKFTLPLGAIQQIDASETAATSFTPCFAHTRLYFIIINFQREQTSGKGQP